MNMAKFKKYYLYFVRGYFYAIIMLFVALGCAFFGKIITVEVFSPAQVQGILLIFMGWILLQFISGLERDYDKRKDKTPPPALGCE